MALAKPQSLHILGDVGNKKYRPTAEAHGSMPPGPEWTQNAAKTKPRPGAWG